MELSFKVFTLFILLATTNSWANDVAISTGGVEGATSISRTFVTKPTTKTVKIRYRFITSEVPAGYFGTEYNDFFSLSVRSSSGGNAADSRSMNSLGLGAFDGSGATDWRETTLSVAGGDTVSMDIAVANVGDNLYDSMLIVDFVEEGNLEITAASLMDVDNSLLRLISGDDHTYFSGNTRIHGTFTVVGPEDDSLTSLTLEIIQGGSVVATGSLDSGVSSTVLTSFGADEEIRIDSPSLLFNIPAANGIDVGTNGTVSLRIKAATADGGEATRDIGTVRLLARFAGGNRYGDRDTNQGGDDWVKPSVLSVVNGYGGNLWGDFSNMHGGQFAPHGSHRTGNDIDGWFSGYNNIDAQTAQTIIDQLNAAGGSNITLVFVSYQASPTDPFWNAMNTVTLNDGRLASDVIRPLGGHDTHFHWRVAD